MTAATSAEDGVVMVIIAVSRQTGEIVSGPDFVTRGLASPDGEGDFRDLKKLVTGRVREMSRAAVADLPELQEEIRLVVRRYFRRISGPPPGRRPLRDGALTARVGAGARLFGYTPWPWVTGGSSRLRGGGWVEGRGEES